MKKLFTSLLLLSCFTLFSQPIYYVKSSGSDGNSGTSWGHAFRTLKKALAAASSGQIWVAAGTYYPDEGPGQTNNDRNASFSLKNNVAIYGGFAGNEAQLSQRDWHNHETILSGDIDHETKPGDNSGNTYHVVRNSSVNNTALLDGFTITGGNANATGTTNVCGGGMHNIYCSPTISHCTFRGNTCWAGDWSSLIQGGGGALYNFRSSPIITGCIFTNNSSGDFGGAISNDTYSSPTISYSTFSGNECSWGAYGGGAVFNFGNSSPNIVNCLFYRNHSRGSGGAISNGSYSSPSITQCTFWGNIANDWGAIANLDSYAKITNCILWGNIDYEGHYTAQVYNYYSSATVTYSIVQGGYGTGNLNSNPLFVNAAGGNFHLQCNSPAVDAGDNAAVSGTDTTDLDGLPRIGNNRVDI